jgi:hypothetical protein
VVHMSRIWSVNSVGFEDLTAAVMMSTTFWDIMPCSLLKVNRLFGATYRIHLQDERINQGESRWQTELYVPPAFTLVSSRSNNKESKIPTCHPLSHWYLARFIFRPWRWKRNVPPKIRSTFNGLHNFVSLQNLLEY